MCAAQVEAYLCDLEEKTWAFLYEKSRLDCGDFIPGIFMVPASYVSNSINDPALRTAVSGLVSDEMEAMAGPAAGPWQEIWLTGTESTSFGMGYFMEIVPGCTTGSLYIYILPIWGESNNTNLWLF